MIRNKSFRWTRLLAPAVIASAACWSKDSPFFQPETGTSVTPLIDVDPPRISLYNPLTNGVILNDNVIRFKVDDVQGANGVTPSGVDPASVTARTLGGLTIPLTSSGDIYTGSITGLPYGSTDLTITAKDLKLNVGTTHLTFYDKYLQLPVISLTQTPPATQSSNATSIPLTFNGSIVDPYLATAALRITQPGVDGLCGTGDDVLWPVGNAPGQISQNPINLFPFITPATGAFTTTFTAYNGVTSGAPRVATYCGQLTAMDNAVTATGTSAPNTAITSWQSGVTWSVAPFSVNIATHCTHQVSTSTTFASITTVPAQPSLPYSVSVTGPGVVSGGTQSGTLDASGQAALQATVNQYGTYNWNAVINGNSGSATSLVQLTPTNTCP